jgi:hypothetical protein
MARRTRSVRLGSTLAKLCLVALLGAAALDGTGRAGANGDPAGSTPPQE